MVVDSFKAARKENYESGTVFGNTDHFGETVTYQPAAGGEARQIDVLIHEAEREEMYEEHVDVRQELIWVDVAKDPGCTRGGIAVPTVRDTILRAGGQPNEPWSWQEQIREEMEHSWALLYGRNRPTRHGPRRSP